MANTGTSPRSFRLPDTTLALLDSRASAYGESANRLARRLLDEALRTEGHPLVSFRPGTNGERQPALVGTRLRVAQVIRTVHAEGGDVQAAASYLDVAPRYVQAALDYYAEFGTEVDAEIDADDRFADAAGSTV